MYKRILWSVGEPRPPSTREIVERTLVLCNSRLGTRGSESVLVVYGPHADTAMPCICEATALKQGFMRGIYNNFRKDLALRAMMVKTTTVA